MFVCPGCNARFKVTKAPASGNIKCPKCGLVSKYQPDAAQSTPAPQPPPSPKPVPAAKTAPQPKPPIAPRPSAGVAPQKPVARPAAAQPAPAAPPKPAGAAPEIPQGAIIAGHKILDCVGGTTYTATFKASQTSMGRTVFFRTLRRQYAANAALKEKFFSGARAMAKFNHPNLLSVFDMGQDGDVCFYTTEYVSGRSLPQFIKSGDKITSSQRLQIATQVCRAFAHVEAAGTGQCWVLPQDITITDKCDVRVENLGNGEPLEGAESAPLLEVVRRLLFVLMSGKDLPVAARKPGAAANAIALPGSRDELGNKLNTIIDSLIKDGNYKLSEATTELEKLLEGQQRKTTMAAAAIPGGVAPRRLEKVRSAGTFNIAGMQLSFVALVSVIAGIALIVLGCLVAYLITSSQREEQAKALWKQATEMAVEAQEKQSTEKLAEAIPLFEQIADQYKATVFGAQAQNRIDECKRSIVLMTYQKAAEPFQKKPEQKAEALATAKSTYERLQKQFPGYPEVQKQLDKRIEYINSRYNRMAIEEWNKKTTPAIQAMCELENYGKALGEISNFETRWSDSPNAVEAVQKGRASVKGFAEKAFNTKMLQVDEAISKNDPTAARTILDKIVNKFGIPEYVEKARERINTLR